MKKLSLIVLTVFILVCGSALALVVLVNPNQFKPLLVNQVKAKTGLDLKIDGNIRWQFFPAIGFELGKTELKNPSGFSSVNLFKVDQVEIDISLFGLMEHQLQIGKVRLEGAEVHLETLKNGTSNLDALTLKTSAEQADKKAAPAENTKTSSDSQKSTVTVSAANSSEKKCLGKSHSRGLKSLMPCSIFKISKPSPTPSCTMCS